MSLNTYTRKLGFVGLTTMTSVFISCKAKTTSSKTAAGSGIQGSCSEQELTTLKAKLDALQNKYIAPTSPSAAQKSGITSQTSCDAEGAAAGNECEVIYNNQLRAYNESYSVFSGYSLPKPAVRNCGLENQAAYNKCIEFKKQLAASNSQSMSDFGEINKALTAVETCEKQIAFQRQQQGQQQAQQTPVISSDTVNDPSNDMNTLSKVQRCTQQYGSLAGVPEGDSCKCYMDTSKQQWRFDAESVCRNYGACTASQYMGVDGKCYSNSILPSTAPSSCPAGQTLLPTKVCGDYNDYVADYQACQEKGAILYTDGKCHKSDGTSFAPF